MNDLGLGFEKADYSYGDVSELAHGFLEYCTKAHISCTLEEISEGSGRFIYALFLSEISDLKDHWFAYKNNKQEA